MEASNNLCTQIVTVAADVSMENTLMAGVT